MSNKVWVILLVVLLVGVNAFLAINTFSDRQAIIVVDVIKVFNDFEMKKELEAKVDVKFKEFTNQIDSTKALLEYAVQQNDSGRMKAINYQLGLMQQDAQRALEISNKNINEQVWKRLNPLIDAFGKEKGYKLIIGANGMGNVLYRKEYIDKTTDVIHFVNNAYNKGE